MKTLAFSILFFSAACFGQQWEYGGGVGGSFLPMLSVSSPAGSASAGFSPGFVAGAFLGQRLNNRISGEVRYTFFDNGLKLTGNGQTATFSANAHAVYYDVLFKTSPRRESRTQFYAAVGGGMKIFVGTGAEQAYQPLSQFAFLTKTHKVEPMADFGGGVKFLLKPHLSLRAEVRDFFTPFPKALITPAPGAKIGSFLHDIVPMVAISYEQ
jgi:hypothetical protein